MQIISKLTKHRYDNRKTPLTRKAAEHFKPDLHRNNQSTLMTTAEAFCEDDLQYTVTFRQARRVEPEDAPPPGRFDDDGNARLARQSRYRRNSNCSNPGIHHRGTAKARYQRRS